MVVVAPTFFPIDSAVGNLSGATFINSSIFAFLLLTTYLGVPVLSTVYLEFILFSFARIVKTLDKLFDEYLYLLPL